MVTTTTGIATEFIQFTRASNATVTDSDGKVKWAPHNLLLASESFDAASWAKSSVTPTANSIAAPNGTTTADTLAASGANGTTLQTFTAEAISYTFGVWLKRKTGTGNIQIAADSGTYTTVTITSDWALYTVTQTPAAGSKSAGIRIVTSADEVYAWGASLYRSDLAMQPNTSAYPLYNPTTPKNLLGYTEDWSNAYWTKSAASIVSNAITAPNGLQTADKIVESATTSYHAAYTGITASANRTFSVYIKAGERTYAQIFDPGNGRFGLLVVDLSNGTIAQNSSAIPVSVTPEGDGWYRVSAQPIATCAFVGVATLNAATASSAFGSSYTGDGTSGIYLWGAQLSDSASLDPYVPVYGAAVTSAAYYGPRRDFDGATLACKGLLVEEQRTNLLLNSATLSTQNVTVTAAAHTLTFYGTGTIALTGTSTAGPLVGTGVNNRVSLTFTPTAGTLTLTVIGSVTQAQLELGSFATSYIPTGAATATRNADVASVSTQAFPYSSTESSIVASFSKFSAAARGGITTLGASTGSSGNGLTIDGQNDGKMRAFSEVNGANPFLNTNVGTYTANTTNKLGIAYALNNANAAANGVAGTDDTTADLPVLVDLLSIGAVRTTSSAASVFLNGHIRQITYLPRRISNTELQTRTA